MAKMLKYSSYLFHIIFTFITVKLLTVPHFGQWREPKDNLTTLKLVDAPWNFGWLRHFALPSKYNAGKKRDGHLLKEECTGQWTCRAEEERFS